MKRSFKLTLASCLILYTAVLGYLFSTTRSQHSEKVADPSLTNLVIKNDQKEKDQANLNVTIAILAKDKAHTLPLYLKCIEKQTWPKERTNLYIRTNNNNDNTASILKEWVEKVGNQYAEVFFDDSDLNVPLQNYKQHEWNKTRFKALGKIRKDSIDWAYNHQSHYFVADCDNFIKEDTIQALYGTQLSIVAPFLLTKTLYSNYHAAVDKHGYFAETPFYKNILYQEVKGLIDVPVVHCTYFIGYEVLDEMSYDDNSNRYEYVIFSDNARKKKIPQYIDNREVYGYITFAETEEELNKEPWLENFKQSIDQQN